MPSQIYFYSKSVLLALASFAFHKGITPPQPTSEEKGVAYTGQAFEYVVRLFAFCSNFLVQCLILGELATIIALQSPGPTSSHVLDNVCPIGVDGARSLSFPLSIRFLFGIALISLGSGIRLWCYHIMGRLFTYEVVITDEHTLITSGPYSYVRHPSYTAMTLMLLGIVVMSTGDSGYIAECAILNTNARWGVYVWLTCSLYTTYAMCKRGEVEDDKLRETFGETWEKYRERVQYMFLPFIF